MTDELDAYNGVTVVDRDGHNVGDVIAVHRDAFSGRPGWVTVKTGWLGGKSLVPVGEELPSDGRLQVPYDRDLIKSAPYVDLDDEEEGAEIEANRDGADESVDDDAGRDRRVKGDHWRVYEHYGLPFGRPDVPGAASPDVSIGDTAAATGQVGHTGPQHHAPAPPPAPGAPPSSAASAAAGATAAPTAPAPPPAPAERTAP